VIPILEVRLETFNPEHHSHRLREWLCRPHVARWWGDPHLAFENSLRCSPKYSAVIVADGAPVGYLCWQTLSEQELQAAGLADLPDDLMDIDVLIGEPEYIDRGLGPRSLGLLLDRLRADPSVSVAGVGTSASNDRALRAFKKAGFSLFREFHDPDLGSCWYMTVDV